MSEQCERMSERTSEWPSTNVPVLGCSAPLCTTSFLPPPLPLPSPLPPPSLLPPSIHYYQHHHHLLLYHHLLFHHLLHLHLFLLPEFPSRFCSICFPESVFLVIKAFPSFPILTMIPPDVSPILRLMYGETCTK